MQHDDIKAFAGKSGVLTLRTSKDTEWISAMNPVELKP